MEQVISIKEGAFFYCCNLEEILLPDSLQIISTKLFAGCRSLKSIVLPSSVNTIESEAFDRCINLSYLEIKGNPRVSKKMYKSYDSVLNEQQDCFDGTPIGESEDAIIVASDEWLSKNKALFPCTRRVQAKLRREWMQQKRCLYCGGEFKGRLFKRCSVCGKDKNY